jgi:hypothetical protein
MNEPSTLVAAQVAAIMTAAIIVVYLIISFYFWLITKVHPIIIIIPTVFGISYLLSYFIFPYIT